MADKMERKVVIPGEIIIQGNDYLPGEGTEKVKDGVVAKIYGLAEEANNLIKVIPLSGVYEPRKGNLVIGKVENITYYGWQISLDAPEEAFLPLQEVPKYVSKEGLSDVLDIGDMVVAKIIGVTNRGIDLTIRSRGLGRIDEGTIMKINSKKVPRIIGREGSMINLIKDETGCNITVGQNGLVWIKGDNVENELLVKKVINFISERSSSSGLTEEVEEFFGKEKSGENK